MNLHKCFHRLYFPPIYRRGGGPLYTLHVFLGRMRVIAFTAGVLFLSAFALWQIAPASLSTAKDWWSLIVRLMLGVVALAAFFRMAQLYRNAIKPRPRLTGREREDAEKAERELFAKAIGAMVGTSTFIPFWDYRPSSEDEAHSRIIWEFARILHERESIPYFRELTAPNARLMSRAISCGTQIVFLFHCSGYKLSVGRPKRSFADGELSAAIEKAISEFVSPAIRIGTDDQLPDEPLTSVLDLVASAQAKADLPDSTRPSDLLICWLASISIQFSRYDSRASKTGTHTGITLAPDGGPPPSIN